MQIYHPPTTVRKTKKINILKGKRKRLSAKDTLGSIQQNFEIFTFIKRESLFFGFSYSKKNPQTFLVLS
jgi:hypothetical protein